VLCAGDRLYPAPVRHTEDTVTETTGSRRPKFLCHWHPCHTGMPLVCENPARQCCDEPGGRWRNRVNELVPSGWRDGGLCTSPSIDLTGAIATVERGRFVHPLVTGTVREQNALTLRKRHLAGANDALPNRQSVASRLLAKRETSQCLPSRHRTLPGLRLTNRLIFRRFPDRRMYTG
jgi:hypothetical protein